MEFLDYYAILDVTPSADEDELRQAYRQAARLFHPDVNRAPGAAAVFRDINAAYEVLSNPARREEYHQVWQDRAMAMPGLMVETLFSRHALKPIGEPQLLYVLVKVSPVLEMSLSTDAPLNLCVVVDRSTSMQGTRLQNVKAAVHHLIDETSRDDVISIVTFSDRAEVLIPAQHPDDPRAMKALVSTIRADGATAMFAGLRAGLDEIERYRDSRYVNHLVLITDGRTYGDEAQCLEIAEQAHTRGVGISGMGMGEDWNDRFLDDLAKRTGGSSTYISAPATVGRFLEDRIRRLATAYAERTHMIVAPTADVQLQSVIRIAPDPMTLNSKAQPIPLGTLDSRIGLKIMLQFHINAGNIGIGDVTIGRVDIGGEVLGAAHRNERVTRLLTAHVAEGDAEHEPPPELLDALSRLALYQLQDRAREALDEGNVGEATRKLEYLATRLFETGEDGLGQAALHEARRVASTRRLSEEGIKNLKYGTRALLPLLGDDHD